MPEHLIRFRGGWEWSDGPADAGPLRRVTLPLVWPRDVAPRVRLVRAFRRPPLDPGRDALEVRLDAVPGLLSVGLNGRELGRPPAGVSALSIPLGEGDLSVRNRLVLEVAPPSGRDDGAPGPPWGVVALAILPRRDGRPA